MLLLLLLSMLLLLLSMVLLLCVCFELLLQFGYALFELVLFCVVGLFLFSF